MAVLATANHVLREVKACQIMKKTWMPGTRPGMTECSYFAFGTTFSTASPASRQAVKPPPRCATGFRPMSCAVLAASAERQPEAQWKMNFLSCWKIGLA